MGNDALVCVSGLIVQRMCVWVGVSPVVTFPVLILCVIRIFQWKQYAVSICFDLLLTCTELW